MRSPAHPGVKDIVYICGASLALALVGAWIYLAVTRPGFWDFDVFYSSARSALRGVNFYATYGDRTLPYWYFPWLAWFFIPLALFPYTTAKILYLAISLLSAGLVVRGLGRYFNPRISLAMQLFITSMSLLMSMLLFIAGQMDFILVGVLAAVLLLLDKGKPWIAGALFPILLFKPHLLAVFLLFLLLRGGRPFRLAALGSTAILGAGAFLSIPNWPSEMVRMLTQYGGRSDNIWNFMTLPQLLGHQENWSGTANLPVTLGLFVIGALASWRFRNLPLVPFLSLTLAASMLCAPRAYTYNLPILMPPMLWISGNRPGWWGVLMWLAAGVGAVAAMWSTGAYLIVLAVFALGILEAHRMSLAAVATGPAQQ